MTAQHTLNLPCGLPLLKKLPSNCYVGDAFDFVARATRGGACNWYRDFGFSSVESDNGAVRTKVFASLRLGERFAVEFVMYVAYSQTERTYIWSTGIAGRTVGSQYIPIDPTSLKELSCQSRHTFPSVGPRVICGSSFA